MNIRRLFSLTAALALFLISPLLWAQESPDASEAPCSQSPVVSVPSRPTVSNGTDTTKCGVLEIEYGLERQWPGGGANRDDLAGGLRLGLTPKLDFHYSSALFLHVTDGDGDRTGFGDTWLGLKYRFLEQTKRWPSVGVFYQAKIPSAASSAGLGSGEVDHAISLLVSKDFHPVHLDFNVTPFLSSRSAASGFDSSTAFALSGSMPLTRRLSLVAEGYGSTAANSDTPAFASVMAGLTAQINPRLVLDAGLDVGVTSFAPRKRVYLGVTYAVTNLYGILRSPRSVRP